MTTQNPIDPTPTRSTEPQAPLDEVTHRDSAPAGDAPSLATPPAGLPLAESIAPSHSVDDETSVQSAAWFDPRPFLQRHAVGLLRAVSVAVVVVILLISWQGVATGQDAPEGAETKGDSQPETEPKKKPKGTGGSRIADAAESHFDMGKLEKFITDLEQGKTTGNEQGTAGVVAKPADGAKTDGSTAVETTSEPPILIIPPVQGPTSSPQPVGSELRPDPTPLSKVATPDLEWHDGFELALALQTEFAELQPVEISALKTVLYQHLLEFSRLAGRSDNPLERMSALAELLEKSLRLSVTEESNARTLLPASILSDHRASPIGWCVIALALADRTRDLVLEPILCQGEIALRYRNGAHRYVLSPRTPDRILTDREFASHVAGRAPRGEIRTLSRPEFWGHVLAEGGLDRIRAGAWARGMELIEDGLDLDPAQPRARVGQAKGFLERREELRALECLDAAVALDATDRQARRVRVELLLDLGRTDAAADDLAFLARDASDPLDTVRYARWWLERREYRRAHATLMPVLERVEDADVTRQARQLEVQIAAAPWIQILEESGDDRARLRAARRLGAFSLAAAQDSLVDALDDPNGHLANIALAILRENTGFTDLPRDADRWRRTLSELRKSASDSPSP